MIHDPRPPVYHVRDFRKYVLCRLEPRFLLHLLPAFSRRRRLRFFDEHLGVHMRIPHFKRTHLRVLAHVLDDTIRAIVSTASPQRPPPMPSSRDARTMLAARRLTSHSHGAGSVSSKSLMSNSSRRSGLAKPPKFAAWQSPHACTRIPVAGVLDKSHAITAAEPRKNANGDCRIRPYRIGKSSGSTAAVGVLQYLDGIGAGGGSGPLGVGSPGNSFPQSFSLAHARFNTRPKHARSFASNTRNLSSLGAHLLVRIDGVGTIHSSSL